MLSGAKVTRVTAHNYGNVVKLKIGPGSIISVCRSGDVIPFIIEVVKTAIPKLPDPKQFGSYHWDANKVDLILDKTHDDARVKRIVHFFDTLGVEGVKIGVVNKLFDAGFNTIDLILRMTVRELMEIEGIQAKSANNLYNNIHSKTTSTLPKLMDASGCFGRSFGETRFKALHNEFGNNILQWGTHSPGWIAAAVGSVRGLSHESGIQFAANLPKFIQFLAANKQYLKVSNTKSGALSNQVITPTGFRDKNLAAQIEKLGGEVADSLSKRTTILVTNTSSSTKITKARSMNITVLTLEAFRRKYGI